LARVKKVLLELAARRGIGNKELGAPANDEFAMLLFSPDFNSTAISTALKASIFMPTLTAIHFERTKSALQYRRQLLAWFVSA
jgi:hypothetical protein